MGSIELLKQVSETMGYAGNIKPEIQKAFIDFNRAVISPGSLSSKTKELIAIATSLTGTCEWCITYHTKMAMDMGATVEEIIEASYVAVLMGGAPALMHMSLVHDAIESFSKL